MSGASSSDEYRGFERSTGPNVQETRILAAPDAVDKYVVSSTLDDPGWEYSTVLHGAVVDEVQALKEAPGRDIVATGSTQLVHTLVAAGLVDEYRLFVFPVVSGTARGFSSLRTSS